MTFKELASLIAEEEGLKEQVSIGNIREILRITLSYLANMPTSELGQLFKRYED